MPEIEQLRAAAAAAVRWLCEPGEPVLVITAGPQTRVVSGQRVSAGAYGLTYRTRLGRTASDDGELVARAPGLLVAGYLLGGRSAVGLEVADLEAARALVAPRDPAAVLVCGGGSARRRDGAPGYIDPRAVPFDDRLAEQIAAADLCGLSSADLALARELLCDLSLPLAVAADIVARWAEPVGTRLDSYRAPYGVANIVARWWTGE